MMKYILSLNYWEGGKLHVDSILFKRLLTVYYSFNLVYKILKVQAYENIVCMARGDLARSNMDIHSAKVEKMQRVYRRKLRCVLTRDAGAVMKQIPNLELFSVQTLQPRICWPVGIPT